MMMEKLIDKYVVRRFHLVMEEADVTRVLRAINNNHTTVPDMAVGSCGWGGESKWFVHFSTTKTKWDLIRKELKVVRVFENKEIPTEAKIGTVYTTD